jgi:hypothetical protein
MNIDSSISPMPARRAERSSNPVDIFANRVIDGFWRCFLFSVIAGRVPAIHVSSAGMFKDVDARDKPGHDQSSGTDCRIGTSAIAIRHPRPQDDPAGKQA